MVKDNEISCRLGLVVSEIEDMQDFQALNGGLKDGFAVQEDDDLIPKGEGGMS